MVETPEQIEIIRGEIAAQHERLGMLKVKDFYAEPLDTHFRTLNTQVKLPNGHVAEFRIDQLDMANAGDQTHSLYEETQAIARTAKAQNRPLTENEAQRLQELIEEQRATFAEPAHKNNLDTLLNETGAARLEADKNSRAQGLADTFGDLGKKGGVVAGVAFGTLSGAFTIAAGGSNAEAAQAVYEAAVPYGETQIDLAENNAEAAKRSATIETASNAGAAGGLVAGAAIGTAILPGVGTAVGAVIGGVAGGIASGEAAELIYDNADEIADWWDDADDELLERLPTEIDDNAPPELQHLVEIKRMLVEAQTEREALGTRRTRDNEVLNDRRIASEKIQRIEDMYDEAYDNYEDTQALKDAIEYLNANETPNLEQASHNPNSTPITPNYTVASP